MARKLTKAQLKRKRQRIARQNFGLNKRPKKSRSVKRRTTKMAKRKRRSYRKSSGGLKPMKVLFGGAAYGAIRGYLDSLIKPVTSKIPLGTIADEATLFTAGYFLNKNVRDANLKNVIVSGMAVEAARIGEALLDGSAFGGSSNNGAGMSSFGATLG